MPDTDDELRVYLSFNVAQGVYQPLTPMGIQAFRIVSAAMVSLVGRAPPDPYAGPAFLVETANRLFLDITSALRSTLWRRLLYRALRNAEARTEGVLQDLEADLR